MFTAVSSAAIFTVSSILTANSSKVWCRMYVFTISVCQLYCQQEALCSETVGRTVCALPTVIKHGENSMCSQYLSVSYTTSSKHAANAALKQKKEQYVYSRILTTVLTFSSMHTVNSTERWSRQHGLMLAFYCRAAVADTLPSQL